MTIILKSIWGFRGRDGGAYVYFRKSCLLFSNCDKTWKSSQQKLGSTQMLMQILRKVAGN